MFEVTLQFENKDEYFLLKCRIVNARKLYRDAAASNNAALMGLAAGWLDVCWDDLNRTIAPDTPKPTGNETQKP